MKSLIELVKNVTSPRTRPVRPRSDTSKPSARSELEVGVANLEREVAGMRTKEVELLERGIARRSRQAERDDEVVVGRRRAQQQARPSRRTR